MYIMLLEETKSLYFFLYILLFIKHFFNTLNVFMINLIKKDCQIITQFSIYL